MFLRSLTLRGFKSFADRTTLEFSPGIGAVVGPNGSGKSNLADAIAWVLGEQGPRALRGSQMADVIFAGSPGRPALGMAEVTMVIDNSEGLIPVDLTEIEVSRVVYRSGESQYLLGGQAVRLMDIQELLSDTGIGRGLHTVVGQGQLEDVLTARPEERRQFIEEASGIAKHRRRKERAHRKLLSLEQDLLRLQDVMAELRRQLRPLKQQAEAATKHQKLSEDADRLSMLLSAARLRGLYRERDGRRSGWELGRSRREEAEERLRALDADIATLGERMAATEQELRAAEEAEAAAIRARSAAETALREAVRAEGQAREKAAADANRSGRLFSLEEEVRRTGDALDATVPALQDKERELTEAELAHDEAVRIRHEAEERLHAARESAAARRAERDSLDRSLLSAEAERERLDASLSELDGRLADVAAERKRLDAEAERLSAEEATGEARSAATGEDCDRLAGQIALLEARERELTVRREALAGRRAAMDITPGRRFLSRSGARAMGLLAEMIQVNDGMQDAVAAALGSLAEAVVYEHHGEAVADARHAGGATLVVGGGDPVVRPEALVEGEQGLLGFVEPDPRVRALVTVALRHVYLAGDPEEALIKHRRHPGASFVTRDGVLVGRRVVRTAPAPGPEAASLKKQEAAVSRELEDVQKDLQGHRRALERVEADHREASEQHDKRRRELGTIRDRIASLEADLAVLGREREVLADRVARLEASSAAARESLGRIPEEPVEMPGLPPVPESPMGLRVEVEALRRERGRLETGLSRARTELEEVRAEDPAALQARAEQAARDRVEAEAELVRAETAAEQASAVREAAATAAQQARAAQVEANEGWREAAALLQRLRDEYEDEDQARRDIERRIADAERTLSEGHATSADTAVAALTDEDTVETLQKRADLVARRLALLGRVNLVASEEYQALQERHDFLQREIEDVKTARRDLLGVVRDVDRKIAEIFDTAFRDVAAEFAEVFKIVFPGGEGKLILTDPGDALATGIEIEARPGRKKVKRLSLLSGGERALTALAFLFAIFRARPSPFYLLDEVEAALDDVNLHRFLDLIRDFSRRSQVLLVTHQKRTMEAADVLYGVSMGKNGVSAVISERVSDAVPASG